MTEKDLEEARANILAALKSEHIEDLNLSISPFDNQLSELFYECEHPALHTAACHENRSFANEAVQLLLKKGARPEDIDSNGRTALIEMVRKRTYTNPVATLLRVSINDRCDGGRTALMWASRTTGGFASRRGNVRIIKSLLERGADPFIRDDRGRTALGYAIRSNDKETNEDVVELLKTAMIDREARAVFRRDYKVDFDGKGNIHAERKSK